MHRGQQDVDSAGTAMRTLLDLDVPPTAVFCANNRNTIGALEEIGRRLRAGADATDFPAIVSFDDFELSGLMPVPVTVLDHDARRLGRETAQLLFERLSAQEPPAARTLELPVHLREPR